MSEYRAITSTRISYTSLANEERNFNATGRFFYLTTGTDVEITVLDNMRRKLVDKVTLVAGRGIKFPESWDALGFQVLVKSATAQAIVLDVIDGEIVDNSFIISASSAVRVTPSLTTLTSDDGTPVAIAQDACTLVSAAAATIQRRWIRNSHATISVYLRSDNTKAQSAIKLGPGDIALVENQSALYVYNVAASGASVDIYVDTETTT